MLYNVNFWFVASFFLDVLIQTGGLQDHPSRQTSFWTTRFSEVLTRLHLLDGHLGSFLNTTAKAEAWLTRGARCWRPVTGEQTPRNVIRREKQLQLCNDFGLECRRHMLPGC